jgi:hypothetical protein
MEGRRNRSTGEVQFPPDPITSSEQAEWEPFVLSGSGIIYSFTVVRQAPSGYDQQSSYIVAMVQLAEGPMVTAQLTDCDAEQVSVGMPVEMITRRLRDMGPDGMIVYGYKFRPLIG